MQPKLSPWQRILLDAVHAGHIQRQWLHGDLEPHHLHFHNVNWPLRMLALRGLVRLHPVGPPTLTNRGTRVLSSQSTPTVRLKSSLRQQ